MISRRELLTAAGFASLGVTLAACSDDSKGGSSGSQNANLNVIWWGADDRARVTNQVADLFAKKHPGSTAKGQFLPFGDYFNKLNTLAASNSLPDILQLNLPNLAAYAKNGLLLDLGAEPKVDLGDYAQAALDTGRFQGKLYGINFGYQYVIVMYNTPLLEKSGVELPADPSDWNAWGDFAEKVAKALGNGVYGMSDNSAESNAWAAWLQGRGKGQWTEDGKIGHEESDIVDWFKYWVDLRDRGAIAPGPESQTYVSNGGAAVDPVTLGKAVATMSPIVQVQGYQVVNKQPLGLAPCPSGPVGRGEVNGFFGWAISAKSKHPEVAKQFLNMWFTDPDAFKILGLDRALPASAKQVQTVRAGATGSIKLVLDFVDKHPAIKPAAQLAAPSAVGNKAGDAFARAAEAVVAGKASPAEAGAKYMSEVKAAIGDA